MFLGNDGNHPTDSTHTRPSPCSTATCHQASYVFTISLSCIFARISLFFCRCLRTHLIYTRLLRLLFSLAKTLSPAPRLFTKWRACNRPPLLQSTTSLSQLQTRACCCMASTAGRQLQWQGRHNKSRGSAAARAASARCRCYCSSRPPLSSYLLSPRMAELTTHCFESVLLLSGRRWLPSDDGVLQIGLALQRALQHAPCCKWMELVQFRDLLRLYNMYPVSKTQLGKRNMTHVATSERNISHVANGRVS